MADNGMREVPDAGERHIITRIAINGQWFVPEVKLHQVQAERDALVERNQVLEAAQQQGGGRDDDGRL